MPKFIKHMFTKNKSIKLISCFLCIFLAGCSQRFQDTNATIKEAFFGFEDIELSKEHVSSLPYPSLYARINDGSQIFMVLALAEPNPSTGNMQLKWMSSDSAMIVTENGRIVKTLRLPETNLVNLQGNPEVPSPIINSWEATYDWQPNYHFGFQALVSSSKVADVEIESLLWKEMTTHIQETVTLEGEVSINDFWVNQKGQVAKTAQWAVPGELYIELEFLKQYEAE